MYWIVNHYWISTALVVSLVVGLVLLINLIRISRYPNYPIPKRKVLTSSYGAKKPKSPLLIRLPKLG